MTLFGFGKRWLRVPLRVDDGPSYSIQILWDFRFARWDGVVIVFLVPRGKWCIWQSTSESKNRPCLLTFSRLGKLRAVLLNVWDFRPTSFGRFNDLNLTLTDAQKAGQDSNSFDWSEHAEAADHMTNTRQMAGTIR